MRNEETLSAAASAGLKVCAYYRMSDDEQNLSISQQQAEVRRFCDSRGWIIVAEYIDKGKSGSKDVAKRKEFHRLINDAQRGEWNAVVCYNSSRFGRLDSISAAQYKDALRKHGVYLETVTEGRIDWRTSMGRIQDAILSEQNNKYSLDLADSTVRGRLDIFARGWWAIGEVPYGYDRAFYEQDRYDGKASPVMVIPRSKEFRKPRNWHTRLQINEAEAAIIKDVFKRYASKDVSLRSLCKELNSEGVASPGSNWTPQILSRVLTDSSYVGIAKIGFARKSKEAHKRVTQSVIENACPSIVDRRTFDRVQEKHLERKNNARAANKPNAGALTGIVVCGHCGYKMDKYERRVGNKRVVGYRCSSGNRRPQLGCKQYGVREDEILPILANELLSAIDHEVISRLTAKPKDTDKAIKAEEARAAELEAKVVKATKNLMLADSDVFAALQAEVKSLKAEAERARNTVTVMRSDAAREAAQSLADVWQGHKGTLQRLSVDYKTDPKAYGKWQLKQIEIMTEAEAIRELLKSLKAKFALHWTPRGERYHALNYGVLEAELSAGEAMRSEHSLNADNNKRIRVHIHGRD